MSQKSSQVLHLEKHLKKPLFNLDNYPRTTYLNKISEDCQRNCYKLNREGEIISLNLVSSEIVDGKFLSKLNQLESLYLNNNNIEDARFLTGLSQLKSLDISNNKLIYVKYLTELKQLQSLNIADNSVVDFNFPTEFQNLQSLNISNNSIFDWSFTKNLSHLRNLKIRGNQIVDGSFLTKFNQLQSLDIGDNKISDWSFIDYFKDLEHLDISDSKITDGSLLPKINQLKSLNVSNNGIIDGNSLSKYKLLESLNINNNSIINGSFLKEFTQLHSLYINHNSLADWSFFKNIKQLKLLQTRGCNIPAWNTFKELKQLKSLDISNNYISDYSFFKELKQLLSLNLSGNNISDWSFIKKLSQLQSLNISDNNIIDGSHFSELKQLQSLDISKNRITNSSFLSLLSNLQKLYISYNFLTKVPIIHSPNLRTLDLTNNKITQLSEDILNLEIEIEVNKEYENGSIFVYGNPISEPDQETLSQGHVAIAKWLQREKRPFNEAKAIVIGESEVGKTSIINQLREIQHNTNEAKTHDIQRHHIELNCPIKENIDLRIWDFGGQDIMHATHKFFLTERCVYLLVVNSRLNENQNRLEHWLSIIASFAGNAPVIVVCNKCDEQPIDLDWRGLQSKYPQIKHFIKEMSCLHIPEQGIDKRKGLNELRNSIADVIDKDLIQVGAQTVDAWFNIKEELEEKTEDYITLDDYYNTCKKFDIHDQAERDIILKYMNDLGVALHFNKNHPLANGMLSTLDGLQVLNPLWVSAAIFKVINNHELINNKGVFTPYDLQNILASVNGHSYDDQQQSFILEMMKRFEICTPFPHSNDIKYLLPDLLQREEPDTGIWEDALRFRYQYKVLPKEIISRFIVGMHSYISANTYWKTGVILIKDKMRAKIKADETDKTIDIVILNDKNGTTEMRRRFLDVIRTDFDRIHSSFNKQLGVKELVPDPENLDVYESYQKLCQCERASKHTIFIENYGDRPISIFLDGISTPDQREKDLDETTRRNIAPSRKSLSQKLPTSSSTRNNYWIIKAAGGGATVTLIILGIIYIPLLWAKIALAIFGIVTTFLLNKDPNYFWRRKFSFILTIAFIGNLGGKIYEIQFKQTHFKWDGSIALSFNILAVIALILSGLLAYSSEKRRG